MKKDRFHYPIFAQRVEKELQDWMKEEKKKHKTWNLFFRELKKRYGSDKISATDKTKNNQ